MSESAANPPRVVETLNVAFWNLQNLFDIEVSQIAADLDFTPVHGWDRRAFEAKVRNLADIIRQMFDGAGPDLLGICEIENERVGQILIDAIGRDDYALAHVEHPDIRGIDTSLIYSTRKFDVDQQRIKGHLVHLRFPTRDIFEVHLKVRSNNADLAVLVNHWPSRSWGRLESEPFRLTVASHCGQLVDQNVKLSRKEYLQLSDTEVSLHRLNDSWDRNVLVMGDLNDEPWNRSVLEILKAGYTTDHLEEPVRFARGSLPSYKAYASRSAYLFNPMWSLMATPDSGTHYYSRGTQTMTMLDQFLLSRGLHFGLQGLQPVQRSCPESPQVQIPDVQIFRPEELTTRKGRPREFRRETRSGYSDHFPVTMQLSALEPPVEAAAEGTAEGTASPQT